MEFLLSEDQIDLNVVLMMAEELARPVEDFGREEVNRNVDYYEEIVPQYSETEFKQLFRMSRATYHALVEHITAHNPEKHQSSRIPLGKKVLVTIYILSTQTSFIAAGDKFNLSGGTAHYVFKEIICTLADCLPEFIRWPEEADYDHIVQVCRRKSGGFPGMVGFVDGCHINIKQPPGNANDYYNRNGSHSIILQGTCDHNMKFTDVYIGLPGRMHDARVYRTSPLVEVVNGLQNNYHILGDSAYPLSINLLTPYKDNGHLTVQQVNYNNKLCSLRSTIERAFGLLKAKFRRLKYLDVADMEFAIKIIAAACVMHNFLIINNEIDEMMYIEADENHIMEPAGLPLDEMIPDGAIVKRNLIAAQLE